MKEPLTEKELAAEFRRLRETETRSAPGFGQSLNAVDSTAPRGQLRPTWQFALAALVLVAAGAVLFDTGRDQSMPESAEIGPAALADGDRFAAFEMPTDFLLDTPWFDLAATTPDFEFELPQYDIPEDLSDET